LLTPFAGTPEAFAREVRLAAAIASDAGIVRDEAQGAWVYFSAGSGVGAPRRSPGDGETSGQGAEAGEPVGGCDDGPESPSPAPIRERRKNGEWP
jgi:hypothetical protein